MSLSENIPTYSIEVSAGAWKQLSHLSLENYQRIRNELDAVAARLANLGPHPLVLLKTVCLLTSLSLVVGEYVVLYDMEPERKRVTLREVARCLPQEY
jgi:mRNA-degrading endonuclease RelE of RelBE toxin-antitoxin system